MKFRLYAAFPLYSTDAHWGRPLDEGEVSTKNGDAYLARLGIAPAKAEEPPADPVEAAALARLMEDRWAVMIEQGVPLRDAAALKWFARKQFRRILKKESVFGAVARANFAAKSAAGGVLPQGLDIEAYLKEMGEPIEKVREKRRDRNTRPSPLTRADRAMELHDRVATALTEAAQKAGFVYVDRTWGGTKPLKHNPRVTALPSTATARPSMKMENIGRKRGYRIAVEVKTDWRRRVSDAGLANILGEKTLVLDADVSPAGTRLVAARQTPGGTIKIEKGWLSLDKNNNRILKKDRRNF